MRGSGAALGLPAAVLAAFAFGIGGPFVRPLLDGGWSESAGVLARCSGTFLALAVPALVLLRGRWRVLLRNAPLIAAYGVVAVAGVQLLFYTAITRMPVGAALLIEYLAPVLLVLWTWVRTRRRPGGRVLAGSALAIAGLLLVVDLGGGRVDLLGPALALLAAVGVAAYYVINARLDPELHPVVLLAGAMLVGSLLLLALGATGLVPLRVSTADVVLAGRAAPWWVSAGVMVLVSTLTAYVLGVVAGKRLGARVASFVGLLEVLFAVLAAWALLGDLPTPLQLGGGVLILAGVVLVRSQREEAPAPVVPVHRVRHLARSGRRVPAARGTRV